MTAVIEAPAIVARLLISFALVAPATAMAETQRSFPVTATIQPGCLIASAAGGSWGRIDFGTIPGTTQGTADAAMVGGAGTGISIECTPGTTVAASVDQGLHAANGTRHLTRSAGGTLAVPYRLMLAGGTVAWDAQTIPLQFTSLDRVRKLDLRGHAMVSGGLAAGRYSDVVRVTLAW